MSQTCVSKRGKEEEEARKMKMMTFQEFLEKESQQTKTKERRERREEWIHAVARLNAQLRAWLADSDPAGVLEVLPIEIERAEPGLGIYTIPSSKISLGAASVEVVPIGRNVLGVVGPHVEDGIRAQGRVDITDGIRRYILYRTFEDGQEKWLALDEHFDAAPLDRAKLEEILQDLLS